MCFCLARVIVIGTRDYLLRTIKRAKEHAYVASHVHVNIHVSRK